MESQQFKIDRHFLTFFDRPECYFQNPLPTSEMKSRHIPAIVRDEVWQRDEGKCQYQDPTTGKVCESRHKLQVDHTKPYARGGSHHTSNLRLLCRQHNLLAARKVFGNRWIDPKIQREG